MAAKKEISPIWKDVILPLGLALIVAFTTWLNFQKTSQVQDQGVELEKKADQIHDMVNSNLTTVQRDLNKALEEIKYLKEQIGQERDRGEGKLNYDLRIPSQKFNWNRRYCRSIQYREKTYI